MKRFYFNTLKILGAIFLFFLLLGGYFINKYYHQYVKSKPKMYCYDNIREGDIIAPVVIIEDLDLKEPYLKYYKELESGIEPILSNEIRLNLIYPQATVYVLEYSEDSLLAKVVNYYGSGQNFKKGWVYSKTLHSKPPQKLSDSLK